MTSSSPGRQGGTGRPSSGTAIGLIAVPLLAAALLAAPAPRAQDEGHVVSASALISRSAVAPGETFKAAVIVKVRAGYHINDNAPLDEFMVPTTLTVADHPDFEVAGFVFPRGRRARFSFAESEL
ncbi:MAG TPA: hypothetical protein PLP83_05440, partial [Candidatus Aminicenantes bacterium]|nr:hypothetical protein [Candidatus Aminicenantes bacterium]